MRRAGLAQLVVVTLAVAFFAGPAALRLVGVQPEAFENRRFAEAPKLSQGWDGFQQASRYLIDRLPLRAQAVRANTRIWTDVFGDDPPYGRDGGLAGDQALPFAGATEPGDGGDLRFGQGGGVQGPASAESGRAGWSFLADEFKLACDDTVPDELLLQRWGGLVRALRASGREAAMFVVPSKASVYPEYLPDEYPFDHCALAAKRRLWRLLARDGPALGVHELRSELVRRKANAGDGLYQRSDTHWTTLGALTLVDAVLDSFGDGVEIQPDEIVTRGSLPYTGDLSRVGGDPRIDTRDEYGIDRAPNAPRVPGRTLVLCDSFAYRWFRLFKPYFENVRYVSLYETPQWIEGEIRRSDRVIVEANELLLKLEAGERDKPVTLAKQLDGGRL